MSRSLVVTSLMAAALIATVLSATGCKKEEQAKEAAPAPVQAPAPAQQAAAPTEAGAMSYNFENGTGGWTGTDSTVKLDQTAEQKKEGKSSLKVSGSSGSGRWNFATSPRFTLEPGKKYKLGAWMYVGSWDKDNFPPLLKCAVYQNNKFASNGFTSKYDLKKSKQWQRVVTIFETPKEAGNITGMVALEKGTQDPINATVYLDDIKVEATQ